MDLGLAGKTAIVTGGGSNIGWEIALGFAKEGANLVVVDIDLDRAEMVAQEAVSLGVKALAVRADVSDLGQVEAAVKRAIDEYGAVDVLVNNVGWDIPQSFMDTTPEFWDKIIAINYRSVLNFVKATLPHMIEQKKGAIVNIGSDAGRMGEANEAPYSGTKGAVIAFSKSIARGYGPSGIRVNVVCPGMTVPTGDKMKGGMWAQAAITEEQIARAAKWYPLQKIGKPEDLANAVVFLASDRAGHITGQTLSVSGGYTMM